MHKYFSCATCTMFQRSNTTLANGWTTKVQYKLILQSRALYIKRHKEKRNGPRTREREKQRESTRRKETRERNREKKAKRRGRKKSRRQAASQTKGGAPF